MSNNQLKFIRRTSKKLYLIKLRGSLCNDCGKNLFDDFWYAEFHHLDPNEKEFDIGGMYEKMSIDKLTKEVTKCILLCTNCHIKRHIEYDKFLSHKDTIFTNIEKYETNTHKKRTNISSHIINKMKQLYNKGYMFSEIAKELDLCDTTVRNNLIKVGEIKPNRQRIKLESSSFNEQFIELWNQNLPYWKIGEIMGGFSKYAIRSKAKQLISLGLITNRNPSDVNLL